MTSAWPWPARGHVDVWALLVGPGTAAAATDAAHVLSGAERARLDELARTSDQALYLVAHVGLRQLLARYLGAAPDAIMLARQACIRCGECLGGPRVQAHPGLRVSLSHAAGLAVVAVATDPVGVDTESRCAGGSDIEALSGYLHPEEQRAIAAYPPHERRRAFLRCWVRKEAYLKGRGVGLSEELDRSNVGVGPRDHTQLADGWRLAEVHASEMHLTAVALLLPPGHPRPLVLARTYFVAGVTRDEALDADVGGTAPASLDVPSEMIRHSTSAAGPSRATPQCGDRCSTVTPGGPRRARLKQLDLVDRAVVAS